MDNLEEMDKFLARYNLKRMNQEEIKMKGPISSIEIETVNLKLPANQSPRPDDVTGKFYQTFRDKLTPNLLKHFQKIRKEHSQTHSMKPPSP